MESRPVGSGLTQKSPQINVTLAFNYPSKASSLFHGL